MPGLAGRVPVLAIRKGDERFSSLKGMGIDDVEKVIVQLCLLQELGALHNIAQPRAK